LATSVKLETEDLNVLARRFADFDGISDEQLDVLCTV
jgi:hypothetical protein